MELFFSPFSDSRDVPHTKLKPRERRYQGLPIAHTTPHFSPWHISGSSSLLSSHIYSCLSCTCGQSPAPMDHQDLDPSTENRWKAKPDKENEHYDNLQYKQTSSSENCF